MSSIPDCRPTCQQICERPGCGRPSVDGRLCWPCGEEIAHLLFLEIDLLSPDEHMASILEAR
jgi:hypothetical protein